MLLTIILLRGKEVIQVTIRPIDLHMMMPKTEQLSKLASETNYKINAFQQQQESNTENKVERSMKQVYSKDKVQDIRISEKQQKNSGSKDKDRREQKKKSDKGHDDAFMHTGTIDIRL